MHPSPSSPDPSPTYHVAILGAGVVGSAIARELSRYQLRCVLIEANDDVGSGTSKANTAIWHTGFDAKPGSLESTLLRRSFHLMQDYLPEAGIPFEQLGAILVAWTPEQEAALPSLLEVAHQNGVRDVHLLTAAEVYQLEPQLNRGVLAGLAVPSEGILCPFTLPIALASQAVQNGVDLRVNCRIKSITTTSERIYLLNSENQTISARIVINCAGLFSDDIDRMMGYHRFTITPRRGELIVFDKLARSLVSRIILPVPSSVSKGVLISPTVFGNVILGPTSESLPDKGNTETTDLGINSLLQKGQQYMPTLLKEEVTATYTGLRAATEFSDYQIFSDPEQRYICVGGIRSTGLSACLGIGEHVIQLLANFDLPLIPKDVFLSSKMPPIGEAQLRPYQMDDWIQQNSAYGRIICHCERVTRGELIDATQSVIPAQNLDALRRRTRALQGRCQGFNCHANVTALLAEQTGKSITQLLGLEGHNGR